MANIDKIRLSGVTYDIVDASAVHDLSDYSTTSQMNAAITAATAALAETISEQGYQNATQVQTAIDESISGKADSSTVSALNGVVTAHTASTDIHVTVADKSAWNAKLDAADVAGLFGYSEYDSTNKRINFYHNSSKTSVLSYIDATDFIKDGMVSNVEIKDITSGGSQVTVLAITFNADSGKEEIDIPISQIFDASNYYTKAETDAAIAQAIVDASGITSATVETMIESAVSGKADSSDVTALNNVVTAHTADTSIHVTSADKTNWNGKADAATTLAGYGITNAYTKSEVDTAVGAKNQVITLNGTTLVIS